MRDERAQTGGGEPSPELSSDQSPELSSDQSPDQPTQPRLLEGIWQRSWGLRLSLGLVAVLIWAGAMAAPSSPQPATGPSVSSPVSTPVMAPASPTDPTVDPATGGPAAPSPGLPQQPLDIQYDYGPGPQPVPGAAP